MTGKPIVYLAGPVASLSDGGAGWRDDVTAISKNRGDFTVRNPLSKYNIPAEDIKIVADADPDADDEVSPKEIVTEDKHLLRKSDAVLVGYTAVNAVGTPMEIMWAYERGYPVVLWIRDETQEKHLSPWYRYHVSEVVHTQKEAIDTVISLA